MMNYFLLEYSVKFELLKYMILNADYLTNRI
jgi:hypothetical protein